MSARYGLAGAIGLLAVATVGVLCGASSHEPREALPVAPAAAAERSAVLPIWPLIDWLVGDRPSRPEHRIDVGAMVHPLWDTTSPADFERELALLDRDGIDTVRVDIRWADLEETGDGVPSAAHLRRADAFFASARRRGIDVIADLWASPCWASSAPEELKQGCSDGWLERGVGAFAPNDPAQFADAAELVARRWGGHLKALEIWNEPNLDFFLANSDDAERYATLVKTTYPRVKAAAPELPVLAGVLSGGDTYFLERLYELGIHGSYDAISIHPYDFEPGDGLLEGVESIRRTMLDHGDRSHLWLTELGWSTCEEDNRCVSEEEQADNLEQVAEEVGQLGYVKALLIYNLRDKGAEPGPFEENLGLIRRDFSAKPGYRAFVDAARYLSGSGG